MAESRLGIPRESWFIAKVPTGDLLIGYLDAQDAFDLWFKVEVKTQPDWI